MTVCCFARTISAPDVHSPVSVSLVSPIVFCSVRARGDPVAWYEILLRCYGALTAIPLRCFLERRATAFVLCMLKVRAVARRSMRSHRVTGDATALFEIALRADRRSAFFLGRRGNAALV